MESERHPNMEANIEKNGEMLLYDLFRIAKRKFKEIGKGKKKATKAMAAQCAQYAFEEKGLNYDENFDRFNYFGEITHALRNGSSIPKPDLQQDLF